MKGITIQSLKWEECLYPTNHDLGFIIRKREIYTAAVVHVKQQLIDQESIILVSISCTWKHWGLRAIFHWKTWGKQIVPLFMFWSPQLYIKKRNSASARSECKTLKYVDCPDGEISLPAQIQFLDDDVYE